MLGLSHLYSAGCSKFLAGSHFRVWLLGLNGAPETVIWLDFGYLADTRCRSRSCCDAWGRDCSVIASVVWRQIGTQSVMSWGTSSSSFLSYQAKEVHLILPVSTTAAHPTVVLEWRCPTNSTMFSVKGVHETSLVCPLCFPISHILSYLHFNTVLSLFCKSGWSYSFCITWASCVKYGSESGVGMLNCESFWECERGLWRCWGIVWLRNSLQLDSFVKEIKIFGVSLVNDHDTRSSIFRRPGNRCQPAVDNTISICFCRLAAFTICDCVGQSRWS